MVVEPARCGCGGILVHARVSLDRGASEPMLLLAWKNLCPKCRKITKFTEEYDNGLSVIRKIGLTRHQVETCAFSAPLRDTFTMDELVNGVKKVEAPQQVSIDYDPDKFIKPMQRETEEVF